MRKAVCGKMKKWSLLIVVLVCCLFPGNGTQAEAASAKTKALKAYKSMLSSKAKLEKYVYYEEGVMGSPKNITFGLAYIDNDNVPELILNAYDEQYLFTYRNGKIKKVGVYFLQCNDAPPFVYYRKKGVFRAVEFFDDTSSQDFYTLKNGKQSYIAGRELFKRKVVKYIKGKSVYSSGKKISKATFNKLLKKKAGNTKATIIKTYRANTAANRNKYLR